MTIKTLNESILNSATEVFNSALNGDLKSKQVSYNSDELINDFDAFYNHSGLYFFTLEKNGMKAVAYPGKSERESDDRLRQHLTGKNKNGEPLKPSVGTKHNNIKNAILNGYTVKVNLYANDSFEKSSLSAVEIKILEMARKNLKEVFPSEPEWILRIG